MDVELRIIYYSYNDWRGSMLNSFFQSMLRASITANHCLLSRHLIIRNLIQFNSKKWINFVSNLEKKCENLRFEQKTENLKLDESVFGDLRRSKAPKNLLSRPIDLKLVRICSGCSMVNLLVDGQLFSALYCPPLPPPLMTH